MIENIRGKIASLTAADVVLETPMGIGFRLNITLPTFSKLEGAAEANLLVYESIREDAWVLYGFLDDEERELFKLLVGVSGVGANTARLILSALPTAELQNVIANGDSKTIKSVKGVGPKTAERIIVDLKDKIKPGVVTLVEKSPKPQAAAYDEALEALCILGFQRQASQKALKKLFDADPSLSIEAAVKKAMAML